MHSLPMTAPSRTWTWCQILVPGPISASSETSAVGWTVTRSRERKSSASLLAGRICLDEHIGMQVRALPEEPDPADTALHGLGRAQQRSLATRDPCRFA